MDNKHFDQLIIGAGFAGIGMGIQLKKAGFNNFIILERNPHLGGTWYDNTYPGAACDVESHLYSYSFEPNPNWSRQFSPQQEILHYIEHCSAKYGIDPHIQFNCAVEKAVYDEAAGQWQVTDQTGKTYTAKTVVTCAGGLSRPSLPHIKGIQNFKGKMFHSARWDNTYALDNKVVGIVGTGASAIQIVPAIAPVVKELQLFQRTPPWILPKPDGQISNFRKAMYRALPFMRSLYRSRLYWTHEMAVMGFAKEQNGIMNFASKLAKLFIKRSIKDETLRKKVTPSYTLGCKRVLLSNEYYPALQRSNVQVITEGISEINATGIKTNDGTQHNMDVLVLATGFYAAEGVIAFDVQGKNGQQLNDAWSHGAEAYLGTSVAGFPNLFFVVGPNTGLGHSSMILMIEAQVNYILDAVVLMKKEQLKAVDVKPETQAMFNADLQQKLAQTVWQSGGCSSWYQTKAGKNVTLWPESTFSFMKKTKKFDGTKYELIR